MEGARDLYCVSNWIGSITSLKCTYRCCNAQPGTYHGLPLLSQASVLVTALLFPFGSMFPPPKYLKHKAKKNSYPSPPLTLPSHSDAASFPESKEGVHIEVTELDAEFSGPEARKRLERKLRVVSVEKV